MSTISFSFNMYKRTSVRKKINTVPNNKQEVLWHSFISRQYKNIGTKCTSCGKHT
jgi:hypothetical protein